MLTMKLLDGLYAYPWDDPGVNNANTYLIKTGISVLVDPGHLQFVDQFMQALRLDGIDEESIQGVVCTHAHPDHLEGLQAFGNRPVWAALGAREEAFLRDSGEGLYRMMGMNPPKVRVDILLKEGDLKLGGETLKVLETPGHTPGSICLYWPSRKALLTGDVVFEMGVGRTDLPGGDGDALIKSLERISRLDSEILLPGHGSPVVGRKRISQNFQMIRETYYAAL
jgi:hydroxyacylglutathione hydrolase